MTADAIPKYLERHLLGLLRGIAPDSDPLLEAAGRLLIRNTLEGHSAIDLARHAAGVDGAAKDAPTLDVWRGALLDSGVVGEPDDYKPLILDEQNRLYLYRYWRYEAEVARALVARAGSELQTPDVSLLKSTLTKLFKKDDESDQKTAAAVAALRRLTVITGGPGTGKTTTVLRLLVLLLEFNPGLRIALAAPTGKAAARVSQSIVTARNQLAGEHAKTAIPAEASTIQRLLGFVPNTLEFRYNADNPLPHDIVVVDEASMIGVSLMSRLLGALRPDTRLILLGDKDQLASVEPGSVLIDVCADSPGFSDAFASRLQTLGVDATRALRRSQLQNCVVSLRHSYRFGRDSGIGRLAAAIRAGDAVEAIELLTTRKDVSLVEPTDPEAQRVALATRASAGYERYLNALRTGQNDADILQAFESFRLLCAFRRGSTGVSGLNRLVESALADAGYIDAREEWYPGRPVMVSRNDYTAALYNGDIGITGIETEDRLVVSFAAATGMRKFHIPRLPEHETVYAMTVHKSQGSEFDEVVLVLPREPSEVMSRELLYTAVTRARQRVEIHGSRDVLIAAINSHENRSSGLRDKLATRADAVTRSVAEPLQGDLPF